MVFAVLIFPKTSIYFKNNILEGLGIGNKAYLKNQISQTITSYWHFIDNEVNGEEVYAKLWKPVFDPKDPEAGIGNGNYKIIKTISGKNVEIVPQGSKGYLIDRSCIGDSSETHAYYFNLIDAPIVEDGDSIAASVYCYVSDDFNGTEAAFRAVGALTGNSDAYYDMNEKGSWQKLIMPVNCTNGELKIYLYMNKGGVRNFSTLEGYVVFAYPEILRVAGREKIRVTSEKDDLKISSSYSQVELSEAKLLQNINIGYLSNIKKTTLFPISELSGYALKKGLDNSDIIRKWIAKIVSEDTVYSGFEAAIEVPKNIDKFGDDRASRWKFAVEIYTKEYNWIKKSFGGGYNFLNWYGYYFLGDKTKSDYPHNPFLHVLLYSGILGLLIYLIFLYRVVYYYLRYIKEFPLFFILFLLTYYFTIFSGGSPFDPPIMGIFMVLPFTIHCVLKRDVSNQ